MLKPSKIIASIVLISLLACYVVCATKVDEMRSHYDPTQTVSALMVKPQLLEIVAGEFRPVLADYLLLKASVFMGGVYETTESDIETVASLFEQSIHLDPYFFQTCYFVQNLLAWRKSMTRRAIKMLEISKKHRYWDWEPSAFIGFDYFYFLKDNLTASKYFMEVAKFPDAPVFYGIFGAHLAQRGGQTKAGIEFLKHVYEKTDNEEYRKQIKTRIEALEGVLILENAVEKYVEKFGKYPERLEELVSSGILSNLPKNPYGRPYVLKDHKVDF